MKIILLFLLTEMNLVPLSYQSVCLSRLLDRIIGTEEVVTLRRKLGTMQWKLDRFTQCKAILSGSRGDGLDVTSSLNIMFEDKHIIVLDSLRDLHVDPYQENKTVMFMRRDQCNIGYIILEVLIPEQIVAECLVRYHDLVQIC